MNTVGKRILLVEDNENDLELTMMALESSRLAHDVHIARDGEQALEYLERRGAYINRPDLDPVVILLDLKLPKIDGLEVLERVRTHPKLKTVPVVMLSSSCEERDIARSYELGVNAYVVKPVDFEQFSNAIKELAQFWATVNQPPLRLRDRRW
jgi:CheY-like chemotaxis protein